MKVQVRLDTDKSNRRRLTILDLKPGDLFFGGYFDSSCEGTEVDRVSKYFSQGANVHMVISVGKKSASGDVKVEYVNITNDFRKFSHDFKPDYEVTRLKGTLVVDSVESTVSV